MSRHGFARHRPGLRALVWLAPLLHACSLSLGLDDYGFPAIEPDAGSCTSAADCSSSSDPSEPSDAPDGGAPPLCSDDSAAPGCNVPPSAGADVFQASIDAPLEVAAPGLLANDTDPDGAGVTVQVETLTSALGGTVALGVSGSFSYTPPRASVDPSQPDSFEYTVIDARGASATGAVRIDFVAAVLDRYQFARGLESFSVDAASGLRANDLGSGVSVVANAGTTDSGGSFSVEPDGSFVYQPRSLVFWGDDAFSYTLTDGIHQTSGRVRLVVQPGLLDFDDIASQQGNGFAVDTGAADTFSGEAIAAAGDTDGDGFADLILLANGQAYLIRGSSRSLNVDLAFVGSNVVLGAIFTSATPLTTVAGVGDVNADGFDDVAVANTTTVFVVFGGGEDTSLDLDVLADGSDPRGFAVTGFSFSGGAPSPVAIAGDVNGDGSSDLVIGESGFNGSTGRAVVVFGKTSTAAIDVAAGGLFDGFFVDGIEFGELTGWAVAGAGDVNGDGLDDVVIGSHQSFTESVSTGKAFVIFGKRDRGLVELTDIANGTGSGFAIVGALRNDFVGHSVASAGDVNGDGLDDVIAGAQFTYGVNDTSGPGGAFIVFGKTDTAPVLVSDLQSESSGGFAVRGATVGDQVGYSVSGVGDVNGDGLSDVAVAALNRGAYIVLGKASTSTVALSAFPDFTLGAGIVTSVQRSLIGAPVSGGGDINGDGLSDVLVGSGSSDPSGLTFYALFGWDMNATLGSREGALRGGNGANSFELPRSLPIAIRGGNGSDTLRVPESGATLDLTQRVPRVESIEIIDLRGDGPQTLRLDDVSVRRSPATRNGVPAPLAKTLTVLGDAEDRLELDLSGFERISDNVGRAVFRRTNAFYGIELSPALLPP